MAMYLLLAFKPNSAVQRPEGLYKEPRLMGAVVGCSLAIGVLMVVDIPVLAHIFAPTAPPQGHLTEVTAATSPAP